MSHVSYRRVMSLIEIPECYSIQIPEFYSELVNLMSLFDDTGGSVTVLYAKQDQLALQVLCVSVSACGLRLRLCLCRCHCRCLCLLCLCLCVSVCTV